MSSRRKRRRVSLLPGNNNKKDNFSCSNYRAAGTTVTQNVSRPGHRYLIQNQQYAAPIVEQYIHTRTGASSVRKNTPTKTQLYNVLLHKRSLTVFNRPHSATLAPNVRSFARMRTTHYTACQNYMQIDIFALTLTVFNKNSQNVARYMAILTHGQI